MSWTCFKISLTKFTSCVKSSIAWAFILSFLLPISSANADDNTQLIQEMLLLLNSNLSSSGSDYDMGADLHALRLLINPESQTNPQQIAGTLPNFLRWFHYELSGNTAAPTANVPSSSTQSLHELVRQLKLNSDTIKTAPGKIDTANTRLQTITTLLRALTNEVSSSSTVFVTNPVTLNLSVTNHVSSSPDILAGNPWWATNSSFVSHINYFNDVFPNVDLLDNARTLTFPQFMSLWSGRLMTGGSASIPFDWTTLWGYDYFGRLNSTRQSQRGYSWFDWMSDAMRSNWVASSTYSRSLLNELRNLSNSVALSPSSVYVTNFTDVSVTNLITLKADDILAGNPWWATNSGFSSDWYNYLRSGAYPGSEWPNISFPQLLSLLSSTYLQSTATDFPYGNSLYDRWGQGGANWKIGEYTYFDWLADYLKSNLVLTTSSSSTQLVQELREYGYETEPTDSVTNTPLPEYSLPSSETIEGASEALESGEQSINDIIDSIPKPGTSGDAEIVVIPEFTVGGIHVREYRASLNTSIVPVCRAVLSFLYGVGLACYVFSLAKSEYVYYATLGRHWGKY